MMFTDLETWLGYTISQYKAHHISLKIFMDEKSNFLSISVGDKIKIQFQRTATFETTLNMLAIVLNLNKFVRMI